VWITVAVYDKYVSKTKGEIDTLDRKLVDITNNDKSFVTTASFCYGWLILNMLNPFSKLVSNTKSTNWLPLIGTL